MSTAYGNDRQNEFHSNIFVCVLYHRANRIMGRNIDSNEVYDGIGMKRFEKDKLVQFLLRQ
jgi:hypothetical protein